MNKQVVQNNSYPLFKSSEILDVISIAKTFNTTPSEVLGVDSTEIYLKYCIDEACAYMYSMMQPDKDGKTKEPKFTQYNKKKESKNPGLDFLMGL